MYDTSMGRGVTAKDCAQKLDMLDGGVFMGHDDNQG
jgi:hypothetical protein